MGGENRPPVDIDEATERLGMDTEFTRRMLGIFLRETPQQIQTIREAMAKADYRTFERVAHSLKGAAATLSVDSVHDYALQLEVQGRERQLKDAPILLDSLQAAMDELSSFLASAQ